MNEMQDLLLQVLLQIVVIMVAARLGAWAMGQLGQPQVVGEIVAGLVLGPSVLGKLFPGSVGVLFSDDTSMIFRVLSELGLILLMFLIGLEFDFSHLRHVGKAAVNIAAAGIVVPLCLGAGLAVWLHPQVAPQVDRLSFVLIVSVALSITAIPILGRMMLELNIHRTPLGTLTITAAAIDDALGWMMLAAVSAMIHGGFELWAVSKMVLWTLAFVLGCWWLARPLLIRGLGKLLDAGGGDLSLVGLSAVLVSVFLAAAATNRIGIFAIFGPFILGAVLSDQHALRIAVSQRLRDIVYALFLPIFFTYTGLQTDIGMLGSVYLCWLCALLILVAVLGKVLGCGLAGRLSGLNWRDAACVAVMMNTRALMGLIVINVGRELGVIPDSVFCMLVIMALFTTLITTPLLRRLLQRPLAAS